MTTVGSFGINGRFITQPMTGVQRYAMNVARAISATLVAQGETVDLLSTSDAKDPELEGLPLRRLGRGGGHVWEQLTLPREWPGALLNLCNTAPALKADQVVCIHDANVFVAPESYGLSFRLFYKSLQPLLARRAARIVTVSNFSAQQIAKHLPLKAEDILILPNGHEHVWDWDPHQAVRAPAAIGREDDGRRPFVLALGSRARHKNLGLLLRLAPELASLGIDLVIAGGQASIYAQEDLQHGDNVKQLGFVTDHDLAYLMERALCLAFPSLTEGFGLPALEAMALGCPVVSTDRASLPEICGEAALLASPDEPRSWIAHIRELARNPGLREDFIVRGQAQAMRFSWSASAQGYLDLMSDLKSASAARPRADAPRRVVADTDPLPRVAVVIATLGRPAVVTQTLRRIRDRQTLAPRCVIISCTTAEDAGEAGEWPDVTVVKGRAGLATQRNAALEALPDDVDVVVFFDDDFVPAADWLAIAAREFRDQPDIVGFTGDVIADGIKGQGLSFDEVDRMLAALGPAKPASMLEAFSPYGCNMAFRRSAIGSVRFDERLVLYGWLEDRDFGAALAARGGRLVKCFEARGVHMGVKSGRISGDRLGYSQVVNPLYMLRKGTMTHTQVVGQIFRNVASNLARWPVPEPFIDRRGRLRGNARGARDVLLGRIEPERAMQVRRNVR